MVKGNPGKRALPKREPKPKVSEPTPPAFLNDDAKVEWGRVISTLVNVGCMTELDRAALAAYCQSYGLWSQAERQLAKLQERAGDLAAMLAKTKNDNVIQHPLIGIANKAKADMVRYAAEFGMTPAARSRIDATKPEDDEDSVKRFFG